MEEFMNQSENAPSQQSQNTQPSPFGVMRLPGRRKRGPDPESLGLSPGGVTGATIKASMLGDLAVIDIANQPIEVMNSLCVCGGGVGVWVCGCVLLMCVCLVHRLWGVRLLK